MIKMSFDEKGRSFVGKIMILLIFLLGTGICLHSINVMHYDCSTHDLGVFPMTGEKLDQFDGHLGYIAYIYQSHHLPQTDPRLQGSFYNPPLFYITEAILWDGMAKAGCNVIQIHEALQWIPFLCAVASMAIMLIILYKIKIRGIAFILMEILICFHPIFSILSLNVNPDSMAFFFLLLIFYLTWRWYEKPGYLRIGLLALAFGLGMLTKLSDALIAPAVAMVFLITLKQGKAEKSLETSKKSILKQYILFLIISVPIGMFWYVRNYIRFGMPMSYIPSTSEVKYLCISQDDLGIVKRLGWSLILELRDVHFSIYPDLQYNIWAQTFKTALVDEKYLVCNTAFSVQLLHQVLLLSMALAVVLNIMFLWVVVRNHRINRLQKAFFLLMYGVVLGNYINFCFVYPQTCTMNYRYIPVTLLFSCIGGGLIWEDLNTKKWGKIIQIGLTALIVLFSAGSAWLYLTQLYEIS